MGNLSAAEIDKHVAEIRAKYEGISGEVQKSITDQMPALIDGATKGYSKLLSDIETKHAEVISSGTAKNAEFAGEIQKVVGISGEAAVNAISMISSIKPTKFKANMKVIRLSYVAFLETMTAEAKTLTEKTAEYMNLFFKTSQEGWIKEQAAVVGFSAGMVNIVKVVEDSIVNSVATVVTALAMTILNALNLVSRMAKNIDMLNLITTQSQIKRWAERVVHALAQAFMTGSVADQMATASVSKAMALAKQIRGGQEAAQPGGAGGTATTMSKGATNATEILNAINQPQWAGLMQATMESQLEMLANINQGIGNKPIGRPASSKNEKAGAGVSGHHIE